MGQLTITTYFLVWGESEFHERGGLDLGENGKRERDFSLKFFTFFFFLNIATSLCQSLLYIQQDCKHYCQNLNRLMLFNLNRTCHFVNYQYNLTLYKQLYCLPKGLVFMCYFGTCTCIWLIGANGPNIQIHCIFRIYHSQLDILTFFNFYRE